MTNITDLVDKLYDIFDVVVLDYSNQLTHNYLFRIPGSYFHVLLIYLQYPTRRSSIELSTTDRCVTYVLANNVKRKEEIK